MELTEFEEKGQAQIQLIIRSHQGTSIKMTSDLLALESMEEIVATLRKQGHLPEPEQIDAQEAESES